VIRDGIVETVIGRGRHLFIRTLKRWVDSYVPVLKEKC
jgi:hypothetical protein